MIATRWLRLAAALGLAGLLACWVLWSYRSGGLVLVLTSLATADRPEMDALRDYFRSWGLLAPVVYVTAVTLEVLVAPVPGTLLYAPAGAIFGGLIGGTLSLMGNVAGAAIAAWLGRRLGDGWIARRLAGRDLLALRDRLVSRGLWVVFLLRVNPLTSSDVVSYAAGAVGVPVRHVALATLAGMAPLCYLQAYLAATVVELLPGSVWLLLGLGVAYVVIFAAVLLGVGRRPS
jgi:uncharacterized membrane protein YdjX (TVP38/TMEM64 family)